MKPLPRVLAIHDLSGIGKCSLSVALPILSVMGVEVAAMPTALLSTHTGGIVGYTYHDLTEDLLPMATHWQSLGLHFDAIYSGWLGSTQQDEIVSAIFDMFAGDKPLRLVDPVMGDHGRLYSTYTPDRVRGMARLCGGADLVTPNLTEALFLLGEPYRAEILPAEEAEAICRRLSDLGPRRVVVTGISTGEMRIGAASWDADATAFGLHEMPSIPGLWHGTGDIFCSVLLGALLCGRPLQDASAMAVDFVHGCIERTYGAGTDPRFGVRFEEMLPLLIAAMREGDADDGA